MQLIKQNPYRTVGLLVGATAKEQERQIRRLKQFIEAEQEPEDDFSFPKLGQLTRTVDSISEATSKLNLDSDKINAAIFWFYNGSHTDEPAFEAIKVGDLDQVLNIWSKLTATAEVTQRNASAYNNLSTLYLSGILEGTNSNEAILEQGISLKLKFLESDFIKDFKALATDETFKTTKKDLQLIFLNQVQSEVDKNGGITSQKFLEILNKQTFSAKEDFLKGFVQKPIEQIEKKIDEAKAERKANKANAVNIGKALFEQTFESLKQLTSILGTSNLKLSSISDKVSDEILQCGIDYFSHFKDSSTDPSIESMNLFRKAKTMAIGHIAKQRCQENTENLEEWIEDKPERERQNKAIIDIQNLLKIIEVNSQRTKNISNAKELISNSIPILKNIKNILGQTDDFYLKLSTKIFITAWEMSLSESKILEENLNYAQDRQTKKAIIMQLKEWGKEAYSMLMVTIYMDKQIGGYVQEQQFNDNIVRKTTRYSLLDPGFGCYIATMAYGDYDHPQVIILRQFRDNILEKYLFGRWFIKTYYNYSPKIVKYLKNQNRINCLIKNGLDLFILLIKKLV